MKKFLLIILALLLFIPVSSIVLAESLWNDASTSMYLTKPHTFKVGDLLTVMIVEEAAATQKAETSNEEKGTMSGGPGTGILRSIPQIGLNTSSANKGKGSTTRGGSLSAKITVQVKEINPNGTLLIEGKQVIKVNKEEQVLTISGIAQAKDVSADNILLSSFISDAVIEYQGYGTVGDTQDTGILTKFFHWLF